MKMKMSAEIQGASTSWVGWRIASVISRRTIPHMPIQLTPSGGSAIGRSTVVVVIVVPYHHVPAARCSEIGSFESAVPKIFCLGGEARDPAVVHDRNRATELGHLLEVV